MSLRLSTTGDPGPGLLQDPDQIIGLLTHYGPGVAASVLAGASVVAAARWAVWRWRNIRLAPGARVIEIAVPPKVEDGSAAAWWARLIGLTLPTWKRALFGQPHLGFEYLADHNGVRFQVCCAGSGPPTTNSPPLHAPR